MRHRIVSFLFALFFLTGPAPLAAATFDQTHAPWNDLLQRHVVPINDGQASQVDYAGMQRDRQKLESYLNTLSAVSQPEFSRWRKEERLAFLINAYNAFTVKLILTKYPDVKSIKDLGTFFQSPWKKKFFTLLGEPRHLDGIEHELIRQPGVYEEPRIHFAVNCASIGCPALRNEAYSAERLSAQLEHSTRKFLSDRSRNRYNTAADRLEVSRIFDWYAEDFALGRGGIDSLDYFFRQNAALLTTTPRAADRLRNAQPKITFLTYDWGLNDIAR